MCIKAVSLMIRPAPVHPAGEGDELEPEREWKSYLNYLKQRDLFMKRYLEESNDGRLMLKPKKYREKK